MQPKSMYGYNVHRGTGTVGQSKVDYVIEVNENYEPTGIFDSKSSPKLPPSTYCLLMAGGKGSRLRP